MTMPPHHCLFDDLTYSLRQTKKEKTLKAHKLLKNLIVKSCKKRREWDHKKKRQTGKGNDPYFLVLLEVLSWRESCVTLCPSMVDQYECFDLNHTCVKQQTLSLSCDLCY